MKRFSLALLSVALLAPHSHARDRGSRRPDLSRLSGARLVSLLQNKANSMDLRSQAAWMLGSVGGPEAVPALIASLDEEPLRFAAARSLGELKAYAAVEELGRVLVEDGDRSVKAEAAEALGKIASPRGLPALLATLSEQDEWNRRDAARAIGLIAEPATTGPVLSALLRGDESAEVRLEAVAGLAKLGDSNSLAAIRAAYDNDPAYRVRSAASNELTLLRAPGGPFDAFQNIGERIKNKTWDRSGAPSAPMPPAAAPVTPKRKTGASRAPSSKEPAVEVTNVDLSFLGSGCADGFMSMTVDVQVSTDRGYVRFSVNPSCGQMVYSEDLSQEGVACRLSGDMCGSLMSSGGRLEVECSGGAGYPSRDSKDFSCPPKSRP